MPKTIIKIRTWRCVGCNYAQDFEPTQELMNVHFNRLNQFRLSDIQENECPACALREKRGMVIKKVTDVLKKMELTVMGEEDIEEEIELIVKGTEKTKKYTEKSPDLSTTAKKNAHRTKRNKNIADAIVEARKHEDK